MARDPQALNHQRCLGPAFVGDICLHDTGFVAAGTLLPGRAPAQFAVVSDGSTYYKAANGPKFPSKVTRGLHQTLLPTQRLEHRPTKKAVTYPKGLVDTQHPDMPDAHLVVSAQSQLSTCEDARP